MDRNARVSIGSTLIASEENQDQKSSAAETVQIRHREENSAEKELIQLQCRQGMPKERRLVIEVIAISDPSRSGQWSSFAIRRTQFCAT